MNAPFPTLVSERLLLRPFEIGDAATVQLLAGDERLSTTTLNVPHPYADGMAEQWIATHAQQYADGLGITLAITLGDCGTLIGAMSLIATPRHWRAELGYWIGVPYWNRGYCTEAVRLVLDFGFRELGYHRITARHLIGNPASGRVMEKAGMRKEGELVDEILKNGAFHTVVMFGLISPDPLAATRAR